MDVQNDKENEQANPNEIEVFKIGETKTIDLIIKDGMRQNFPYSHYLSAWLDKEDEDRVLKIFFATHLITVQGYCLDEIYNPASSIQTRSSQSQ